MSRNQKYALAHNEGWEVVRDWWRTLDKGGRAQLRRADGLLDVALCPAFHDLRLALKGLGAVDSRKLAVLAGVLCHLRSDLQSEPFAKTMARPKTDGANPRVSGVRFRRLLQLETIDAGNQEIMMRQFRRILALTDHSANLLSLGRSLYFWNEKTKQQWAETYYETVKTPSKRSTK